MSDQALIGPISLPTAQLMDGDSYAEDGEKLSVYGTEALMRQIQGLTGTIQKAQYGFMKILSSDSPWGPIWVDGSVGLKNNDNITHRGWYLLGKADPKIEAPGIASLDCDLELLKVDPHEILDIMYTPGYNDGTVLSSDYDTSIPVYKLQDVFDTFDNAVKWYGSASVGIYGAIAAANGKLNISGAANTGGIEGTVHFQSRNTYDAPFDIEFSLGGVGYPVGVSYNVGCFITPNLTNANSVPLNQNNSVRFDLKVTPNGAFFKVYSINKDGKWTTLIPDTSIPGLIVSYRISFEPKSRYIRVEVDSGSGYVLRYTGPTQMDSFMDVYVGFFLSTANATSQTGKIDFVNVYSYDDSVSQNIIATPIGGTLNHTPDFTRTGEDGAIPCFLNPNFRIALQTTPANLYNGSVKAYNNNYTDNTARLITNQNDILDPAKFSVKNGLIKLVTTANSVQLWYWNGTAYIMMNEFNIGTIDLLKPIYVGPDRFTFQADMTKWTMWRGKPFIQVEHPETDLLMNLAQIYNHDGVTITNPAANTDISMLTQNYCTIMQGYTNLLTSNQADCCANGTTTGFVKVNNATISVSTEQSPDGGNVLKVATSASGISNGVTTGNFGTHVTQNYTAKIYAYIPLGIQCKIYINAGGGGTLITGTGAWNWYTVTENVPSASTFGFYCYVSNSITNVYIHKIQISNIDMPWIAGQTTAPINNYGLEIIKQSPTTIKSDKIPADILTGIGVYDNTVSTSSNDYYANLAREFLVHPIQKIGIKQV